jgi:hypothetical protein
MAIVTTALRNVDSQAWDFLAFQARLVGVLVGLQVDQGA